MSFLNSYRTYATSQGSDMKEYLVNTSKQFSISQFKNHPSHKIVNFNETDIDVRVIKEKKSNPYTSSLSELVTFVFMPDTDVNLGDLVTLENKYYIIFDGNESDIYPTYYSIKSNNTFKVLVDETKPILGYTSIGQPIYGESTKIYFEKPCYATYKSETSYYTSFDGQVNSPMGRMLILIPNDENSEMLKEGMEFELSDVHYKIANVDRNNVNGTNGFIELFVEKIQSSSTT